MLSEETSIWYLGVGLVFFVAIMLGAVIDLYFSKELKSDTVMWELGEVFQLALFVWGMWPLVVVSLVILGVCKASALLIVRFRKVGGE